MYIYIYIYMYICIYIYIYIHTHTYAHIDDINISQKHMQQFTGQKISPVVELRLEHEMMQEKFAQEEHESWRRDVASRLMQIREKPRLKLGHGSLMGVWGRDLKLNQSYDSYDMAEGL